MNLVEFIICSVYVVVCGAITWWLGAQFGIIGYVGGFLLGTLATMGTLMLLAFVMIWFQKQISLGVPSRPACKNGCCTADDYKMLETSPPMWMCKCGDCYDRRGKRFVRIDPDGKEIPYLRWKPFGSWVADE
jgi:hypothetical protein